MIQWTLSLSEVAGPLLVFLFLLGRHLESAGGRRIEISATSPTASN
ncbi:MAG: hypothetical protein O7A04_12095 [Acidobacteria bacterium]|nr:hypothetical protein [Acidobacteriota bacterium]